MKTIKLKEHENFYGKEKVKSNCESLNLKEIEKTKSELFDKNQYSKYKKDKDEKDKNEKGIIINAYYIGVDWLIEDELALMVKPKIENLDFLKMFIDSFKYRDKKVSEKINEIYNIELNQKPILLETPNFEVTPLIIIHFLEVLKNLVQRGLKKNYVRIEENLSSKIKGKIVFSQHLKKNIVLGRNDKVFCNYQDYSVDCLENQILKKALLFCQNYLNQYFKENQKENQNQNLKELNKTILFCKSFFSNVSDNKESKTLKQFKINKLYRDYTEALQLAQMILRRFGYNIQETHQKQNKIPPFWINMALLFEVYVLSKLKSKYGSQIRYQFHGNYGETDFLKVSAEEKIIIDAKYKDKYKDEYDISDIRQLSGYARDGGVLEELEMDENTVVPCLIIYPNQSSGIENFESEKLLHEDNRIKKFTEFTKFYKIGIQLPSLT